jgi:tetrapyrrole methylase family protein/MazG family protein
MAIVIVGLGPGDPALLTRQAWDVLSLAGEIYLRTGRHPVVSGLPSGAAIHSFDQLYEEADSFERVYQTIVDKVLELSRRPSGVVYGVPGHPLVGEATVTALLDRAKLGGVTVRLVAGLSFIEPVLAALQVDGMTGLQVVDALEVASRFHPPFDSDTPALLGQLYDRHLASHVKLTLMNQYPDEHPVVLVHSAGTSAEVVEQVPLYAVDRSELIDHLTALYVPPLPRTSGFVEFRETIAHLRGPNGCPWDRRQTHGSLREPLISETAEVMDALDEDDTDALCEELGDLLLLIVMHMQIATEEDEFSSADVIGGIDAKIRRRHPHVFGSTTVNGVEEVLSNWDAIKREEKGKTEPQSALDGVPVSLSALSQASELVRRAAKQGFQWPNETAARAQVQEELSELWAATTPSELEAEFGDLLFALVGLGRWLELDPEIALRLANRRFRMRFQSLEQRVRGQGRTLTSLRPDELLMLWRSSDTRVTG